MSSTVLRDAASTRIDREISVTTPSGNLARVIAWRFNVAFAADGYVQLTDGAWIKARLLTVVEQEQPHRWDPSEHHEPFHIEWEDA